MNKESIIVISRKLGLKKKLEISKIIKNRGLKVENIDTNKLIEDYDKKVKEKKETAKPQEKKTDKEIKRKVLEKKSAKST